MFLDPTLGFEDTTSTKASSCSLVQKVKVLVLSSSILLLSLWAMSEKSEIPEQDYDKVRETWFGHKMS
jgi:hypothetical protein